MHYLIYVSRAARPMTRDDLADLLDYSRTRNTREGITGLLIYRQLEPGENGCFLQLLEGDATAVEAAWERIAADPRHHTVIGLEEGEVATRAFPDWSMGFRSFEPGEDLDREGYSDLGSSEFWERARVGALPSAFDLLRSFYESQ